MPFENLIRDSWDLATVAAFVARLRLARYKVLEFAEGWSTEVDGYQVFRATNIGNARYDVRYDERMFPDV